MWALDKNAEWGEEIPMEEFKSFCNENGVRVGSCFCPEDPGHSFETSYRVNPVGEAPECRHDERHRLPSGRGP
ncbi:MAG: hypothetical protein R6V03_05070 [Kiritimatiellia bacterium]